MTELFFEGAEPMLTEVPLEELLALFPEGDYEFEGKTVDGGTVVGSDTLMHAVPAAPGNIAAAVGSGDSVVISWDAVTGPAPGFPDRPITIVGYQIIVGSFQVTVPDTTTMVTVPPEFVASLGAGQHGFEILAIAESGNQTIGTGEFEIAP
jgi:hypothetical protein